MEGFFGRKRPGSFCERFPHFYGISFQNLAVTGMENVEKIRKYFRAVLVEGKKSSLVEKCYKMSMASLHLSLVHIPSCIRSLGYSLAPEWDGTTSCETGMYSMRGDSMCAWDDA